MLVKLPGGKVIVVDSKVPLDAYLAHLEAQTDDQRGVQMARHARQTRDHITKLASKGYQRQFDATPDLVVMFVPSEGIYQAALAEDPALIEYGVHQQVLMATPTTLIGLLRAVHYGWRQELIAESAREIAESARELHRRIARFVDPLAKVGRQLGSAVGAYNEAVGSFDSRVMPQLRRIEEAGAKSERELARPRRRVEPTTARRALRGACGRRAAQRRARTERGAALAGKRLDSAAPIRREPAPSRLTPRRRLSPTTIASAHATGTVAGSSSHREEQEVERESRAARRTALPVTCRAATARQWRAGRRAPRRRTDPHSPSPPSRTTRPAGAASRPPDAPH